MNPGPWTKAKGKLQDVMDVEKVPGSEQVKKSSRTEVNFDLQAHHLTAGPGKFHSLQLSLSAFCPSPSHP